jgi:hypothetical protein
LWFPLTMHMYMSTTNMLLKINLADGVPLWKIVWVFFYLYNWVLIRHPIIIFCMFKNMLQIFSK